MVANKRKAREERMSARDGAEARSKGGGFSAFELPSHVSILKLKPGRIKFNVIPHRAGSNNLYVDKGRLAAEVVYYVHKGVGPGEALVVCPREMKKSARCACCDLHAKMREDPDADKETVNKLKSKRRIAMLVQLVDKPEDGLQLLDQAYFKSFGALLDDQIKQSIADGEEGVDAYADPEEGMTLRLNVAEDSYNGRAFSQVTAVNFLERKTPLTDDILEAAFSLDDALRIPTYAETLAAVTGGEDEDEDEDEPKPKAKSKSKSKPVVEDDDDEEEEEDEEDEPKPKAKSTKPASKTKAKPVVEDDDDEEEDEEEDEPKPKAKTKPKPAVEDDDDWDDDEEEEAPKPKAKTKSKPVVEDDDADEEEDEPKPKAKATKPASKTKAKPVVEDDDDEEEDEEEDEPKPKAKATKPASKTKPKPVVEDDDDDWDDEEDEPKPKAKSTKPATKAKAKPVVEDDDEEDEPKPKAKSTKPASKTKSKPVVEDDDDGWDEDEMPF